MSIARPMMEEWRMEEEDITEESFGGKK